MAELEFYYFTFVPPSDLQHVEDAINAIIEQEMVSISETAEDTIQETSVEKDVSSGQYQKNESVSPEAVKERFDNVVPFAATTRRTILP